MIPEDELRVLQTRFEPERQQNQSHYRELEKLRRKFVSKFPPSRIPLLSLDDYVEGNRRDDSFCYWVEWKTAELGRIQGSPAKKFGVFFNKKTQRYDFTAKFASEGAAITFLRAQIARLLDAGRANNLEAIRQIEISPMFKGKILSLYYPEKYLNVLSEDHIDHFLRAAELVAPNDDLDVLAKRDLLLAFKAGDEVMSTWTTNEFMYFLYDAWRPLPKSSKVPAVLRKYVDAENFPPADSTRGEFISFELGNAMDSPKQGEQKRGSGEIDFERQNRRNKRIGDQGEDVVYWAERRWLEMNGRRDLAQNVEAICRKNAGAGYDVKSFELDGTVKYIEVKATTSKPPAYSGGVRFHISATEFEQAQKLPNYYLFIVFDVKSANPKIWRIRDPATLTPSLLVLQPSAYHATLTAAAPKEADAHE
jgi:hypothetical protein